MALITRKLQGTAQDRIRTFVAEHAEALEPGLSVLETSLRLGRATVDVVALDAKQTLVLVTAAEVADEKMLVSILDAYIWCLAFPDNVRRLYPTAPIAVGRPPRVIIVAERVPDTFLELVERLSVVNVECQELSGPAASDREKAEARAAVAEPTRPAVAAAPASAGAERHVAAAAPVLPLAPVVAAPAAPMAAPGRPMESGKVPAGFDAIVAQQWASFLSDGAAEAAPEEQPEPAWSVADPEVARIIPSANGHRPAPQGTGATGHTAKGQPAPATNGHAPVASPQPGRSGLFAQAVRTADAALEHAAVDLGIRRVVEPAAAPAQAVVAPVHPAAAPAQPVAAPQPPVATPQPSAPPPAPGPAKPAGAPAKPVAPARGESDEPRTVNHPALESLRFPKSGVSRQWQDFLDQLAANQ